MLINFKHMLDKSFQNILHRIDNWINEGFGWMIESTDAEYANILFIVHYQQALTLNYLVN